MALALMVALLFGVLAMFGGKPAGAEVNPTGPDVTPKEVEGNPNCTTGGPQGIGLGYDYGFKIDGGALANQKYSDGTLDVTISNLVFNGTEKVKFDWASNIGVDAVIVKSQDANTFVYDPPGPESLGDNGLYSPENKNISHIEFCYDLELQVSKTANTSLTRTFDWTIDKSVSPETWDLFKGDSGTSEYTVKVEKNQGTDSKWKVTGTITVTSPINNASVTDITDVVSQGAVENNGTILACTKNGNPVAIPSGTSPVTLNTSDKLECTYKALLQSGDNGKNTATAKTNTTGLQNGTGTADVDFSKATITKVNDQVTVKDVFKGATTPLGTTTESETFVYQHTFRCNADKGTHENTATVYGDNDAALGSDSASVTVNCHALAVSKDATTSLEKKWTWTVDKSADQSSIVLSIGQTLDVNYDVVYNASSTEGKYAASGNITVKNNAPIDATINSVSDVISGVDPSKVSVDCGSAAFPYTLAKNGGELKCAYTAELPNKDTRTNTATATLQNYAYDSKNSGTPSGTTNFTGTAQVSFANATVTEIDEEITVSDTFSGSNVVGTVTANQAPKTFEYIRKVGPYETCGTQPPIENTAKFVTNDTKTEGQDSVSIPVNVPCGGCTLTIGYWKTHADPTSPRNNPDATLKVLKSVGGTIWLGTPGGTQSVAVTKDNVVSILKFDGTNGIKKLQAQLLGAKLNIANGADGTAVQSTIQAADLFLAKYGASDWSSLSKTQKQKVLNWMTTLDDYNNGRLGPGHCSEERLV